MVESPTNSLNAVQIIMSTLQTRKISDAKHILNDNHSKNLHNKLLEYKGQTGIISLRHRNYN